MLTSHASEIEQVAQSVFSTMLNIELFPLPNDHSAAPDSLVASIHITGNWVGTVILSLSPQIATSATAALLQIGEAEVTDSDLQDVAAELVNMIGGNLKSMLPGPSSLSLPTVVMGREFGLRLIDAELLDDVLLGGESGTLRIRLYAQSPQ